MAALLDLQCLFAATGVGCAGATKVTRLQGCLQHVYSYEAELSQYRQSYATVQRTAKPPKAMQLVGLVSGPNVKTKIAGTCLTAWAALDKHMLVPLGYLSLWPAARCAPPGPLVAAFVVYHSCLLASLLNLLHFGRVPARHIKQSCQRTAGM